MAPDTHAHAEVFDLRRFAADPKVFILRDSTRLEVPSDPDVGVVAQMLRIRKAIEDGDETATGPLAERIIEGKALLLELVREYQPDVEDLHVGVKELLAIFSLIRDGHEAAEAVAVSVLAAEQAQADPFDLRRFAGLPIRFTLRDGKTYAITSDPDVDVVMQMLVLERSIRELDTAGAVPVYEAVVEARELVLRLVREHDPKVRKLPVGVGDILAIFGLLTGGESVAQSVAEGLTAGRGAIDDEEAAQRRADAAADDETPEAGDGAPLPSRKASGRRSSRSATATAGRRTTGED